MKPGREDPSTNPENRVKNLRFGTRPKRQHEPVHGASQGNPERPRDPRSRESRPRGPEAPTSPPGGPEGTQERQREQPEGPPRGGPKSSRSHPKGHDRSAVLNPFKTTEKVLAHRDLPRPTRSPQKARGGHPRANQGSPGGRQRPQEGPRGDKKTPGRIRRHPRGGGKTVVLKHSKQPVQQSPQGPTRGLPGPPGASKRPPRERRGSTGGHQETRRGQKQICHFEPVQNPRLHSPPT